MAFTPCKQCPRPDWCSAGTPRCEIPSLEEAAENLRALADTSVAAAESMDRFAGQAGEPRKGAPDIELPPPGDEPGTVGYAEPGAPRLLEVNIRWPSPEGLLRISPPLAVTAAQVWRFLAPDDDYEASAARHELVTGAAGDALALLQERIMTISAPGKVSPAGMFSAMTALVAMYLTSQWVKNPPRHSEHAAHISSMLAAYAHAITVEIMRDLQNRGLAAPPPAEPTEADKIAEAFRNG